MQFRVFEIQGPGLLHIKLIWNFCLWQMISTFFAPLGFRNLNGLSNSNFLDWPSNPRLPYEKTPFRVTLLKLYHIHISHLLQSLRILNIAPILLPTFWVNRYKLWTSRSHRKVLAEICGAERYFAVKLRATLVRIYVRRCCVYLHNMLIQPNWCFWNHMPQMTQCNRIRAWCSRPRWHRLVALMIDLCHQCDTYYTTSYLCHLNCSWAHYWQASVVVVIVVVVVPGQRDVGLMLWHLRTVHTFIELWNFRCPWSWKADLKRPSSTVETTTLTWLK